MTRTAMASAYLDVCMLMSATHTEPNDKNKIHAGKTPHVTKANHSHDA